MDWVMCLLPFAVCFVGFLAVAKVTKKEKVDSGCGRGRAVSGGCIQLAGRLPESKDHEAHPRQ